MTGVGLLHDFIPNALCEQLGPCASTLCSTARTAEVTNSLLLVFPPEYSPLPPPIAATAGYYTAAAKKKPNKGCKEKADCLQKGGVAISPKTVSARHTTGKNELSKATATEGRN